MSELPAKPTGLSIERGIGSVAFILWGLGRHLGGTELLKERKAAEDIARSDAMRVCGGVEKDPERGSSAETGFGL